MELSAIMQNPVSAAPTDTTFVAAELMRDHNIGCLVISEGLRPIGMITDRDIAVRCSAAGHDPLTCTIENHMSGDLTTARPNTEVLDALHLMLAHKVKRLPVVEQQRVVGIVSYSDVAGALDVPLHELLSGMGAARRDEARKLILP